MGRSGSRCRVCLGVCFPSCFLTGLVLIGVAVGFYLKFPDIETQQINKKVTVEEGHATYEQLESPTIPIFKDFYFFNLTNFEEFHSSHGGEKPELTEVGPYSFSEYRTKTFFPENYKHPDQIMYNQQKIFFFNESTSGQGLQDTDTICTINIPMVAAITTAENESPSLPYRIALRRMIERAKAKLYICIPAKDLAWSYTDKLIGELHFVGQFPDKTVNIQVNNSADDLRHSIINNGVRDISKVGEYVQWNGRRNLGIWNVTANDINCTANDINGTEGFFFKPNLAEGENLTAFVDDIKRSIDIVYLGKVEHLGLSAFRYGIDNRTFKSAFSEPENARWRSWCPDGMFYLGPTQPKEIPVYGSKPHFLDGDPLLLDSVVGLKPDRSLHDTVIDVEPATGANLNFQRQLQINVQVNRTNSHWKIDFPMTELTGIEGYKNSGVLYYPVLYINERATINQAFKDYLESKGLEEIQILNILVPVAFGVLIFVGVICLLISMFACAGFVARSRAYDDGSRTPLLNPSD